MVGRVDPASHWDDIYLAGATEDLGWYEPRPSTLDLVLGSSRPADSVIDVGAGDSRLADELLDAGYDDVTALDLATAALDRVRHRLGPGGRKVTWIRADVTTWTPPRRWDLWHDRAVFHFLDADADRRAYKAAALRSLTAGGRLIVAAFALGGPERCAGLPVRRYDAAALAAAFAPELSLVEHRHIHTTTGPGDSRPYTAVVLERT